jgi:hypothetical protein
MSAIALVALVLMPGVVSAQPPGWLGRCLDRLRPGPLEIGAPLPTDSPRTADHGVCAARCEGRCFLIGDFDGDGRARDVAVASATELLVFHDVRHDVRHEGKRRLRAAPAGRLPLQGEEVALLPVRRAVRFIDEVGLLREGRSLLPSLGRSERLAFALIVWHNLAAPGDEEEEEHGRSRETGDLLLAIFDEGTRAYRLQRVLTLGGGGP